MMQNIKLRGTGLDDAELVSALLKESYPVLLCPDYAPEVLAAALGLITQAQPELRGCGTYYVAQDPDGRVLAAGEWTPTAPRGPDGAPLDDLAHIRHVVTDWRCTKRGIGRAIMGHLFASARSAGVQRLACLSTLTAVPFYSRLGFDMLEARDFVLPGGVVFPAVRMERDL